MNKTWKQNLVIASLILPGIVLFIFAVFVPVIMSVYFGMTDMEGGSNGSFIGLQNYWEILTTDMVFWKSLLHAFILGVCLCLFQHPVALILAILLDKIEGRLEKFFRAVFFIPVVISAVVISKMWASVFDPTMGLLNKVFELIGLGFLKQQWLGDPKTALPAVMFIVIWHGLGMALLIYYAGVKGIPGELYEAAEIDGATGLMLYWKITIPLLAPVISVCLTLAMISALKQMETVFLTTNGGPGDTTQFIANYLYSQAFSSYKYGYANALSVLFVIICVMITYAVNKFVKSDTGEY